MTHRWRLRLLATTVTILLFAAHRLPAPISEESPTPKPEQSEKPKLKRTMKPTASQSAESPTKQQKASPTPILKPNRNVFDGTWRGIINIGWAGDVNLTLRVSAGGTVLTTNPHFPDWHKTLTPICDGHRMTWKTTPNQTWTLTPNSDGQTAVATGNDPGGFAGLGAFDSSATFRKASP
jgi:hypothetical protein